MTPIRSTYFGLLAEFGAGEVKLADCCEKYFGLNEKTAKQRASDQRLPVPVYRAVDSQKGELLISIADLAEHLDAQKAAAKKLHQDFNLNPRVSGLHIVTKQPKTRAT